MLIIALIACNGDPAEEADWVSHGLIAENISAPLGQPVPYATDEQLAAFERGLEVGTRRFDLSDGLGPAFNVSFCLSCHERPVFGGSAGHYRNFFIGAEVTDEGSFFFTTSADNDSGVLRMYSYGEDGLARPEVEESANIIAQRNPIPFFGVGLIAELDEDEILQYSDPDDEDGDGISGRPNYDRGFVGRFGRKAQTVSIEGFIRGPLFNHLGVSSDPLSEAQRAELPIDSSGGGDFESTGALLRGLLPFGQAAAPDGPLFDNDGVKDPELSTDDLFDLVSFTMLMAAPQIEDISGNLEAKAGQALFDELSCGGCHVPRLEGPRGPLPLYSDLLLHDMGEELADGLRMKESTGSEYRTQPLWGIGAVGPYLHDGRASTLSEAILAHAGEGAAAAAGFAALSAEEQAQVEEFLLSLGGRDQITPGLIPPDEPLAEAGAYGGPVSTLSPEEEALFLAGRALFDQEFGISQGLGTPRFNGDSCRACHFEPVFGGAGPRGVNVMRHGILNDSGEFVPPSVGTVLHKQTILRDNALRAQPEATIFEHRQTPHLFGLGLIEGIPESVILANADPDDTLTPDGITGRVSWTDDGRLGRFGWKAQVPDIAEFVRDAVTVELGMTLDDQEGLTFGLIQDNDAVADPEYSLDQAELLTIYLTLLGPPPRQPGDDALIAEGEALFAEVGCASCHTPTLDGVPLYSDLLLHETLPADSLGIEEVSANMHEFRTPPLWGLSQTAPYLHSGRADTIFEAIAAHYGEAESSREDFLTLSDDEQDAVLVFLESL